MTFWQLDVIFLTLLLLNLDFGSIIVFGTQDFLDITRVTEVTFEYSTFGWSISSWSESGWTIHSILPNHSLFILNNKAFNMMLNFLVLWRLTSLTRQIGAIGKILLTLDVWIRNAKTLENILVLTDETRSIYACIGHFSPLMTIICSILLSCPLICATLP